LRAKTPLPERRYRFGFLLRERPATKSTPLRIAITGKPSPMIGTGAVEAITPLAIFESQSVLCGHHITSTDRNSSRRDHVRRVVKVLFVAYRLVRLQRTAWNSHVPLRSRFRDAFLFDEVAHERCGGVNVIAVRLQALF
ncbi:MAG: hypothetical protein ACREA9_26015, partial [Pyrinomonadaceae bacterium]